VDDHGAGAAVAPSAMGPAAADGERTRRLEAMLRPRSVVIVGVPRSGDGPSARLGRVLTQRSFGGRVYGVNPNGGPPDIGFEVHRTIAELPEVPDLALVVVSSAHVERAARECAEAGIGGLLVHAAAETSPTPAELDAALAAIADEYGIPIIGPNSVGFWNGAIGLAATWSPVVDLANRGVTPRRGPAAIVSQSGGLGFGFLAEAHTRGLGVRYAVSVGNEAALDCVELAQLFLDDADVTSVLLFIEGLHHPRDLVAVARKADALGKTLVVAKVGRSEAAGAAGVLHTAHLAGDDAGYQALFEQYGIERVHDAEEMVDIALAATCHPRSAGRRVGIVSMSGGAGAWLADACEAAGLEVPRLSAEVADRLRTTTGTWGTTANPIDISGGALAPLPVPGAIGVLLDADVDAIAVALPLAGAAMMTPIIEAIDRHGQQRRKPLAIVSYAGLEDPAVVDQLAAAGIPWYPTPTRAARALAATLRRGAARPARVGAEAAPDLAPGPAAETFGDVRRAGRRFVHEHEVKQVLARRGVTCTREVATTTRDGAVAAAAQLGGAVALKVQSTHVVHKSEAGLLALDVRPGAVAATFDELWERCRAVTGARPDAIVVAEMVRPLFEAIVGVRVDADFGPLVMVGEGGRDAELLADRVFRLTPLAHDGAVAAIRSLRCAPRLLARAGDEGVGALAHVVTVVARWADEAQHEITGIDLNPVALVAAGPIAVVVDASAELA